MTPEDEAEQRAFFNERIVAQDKVQPGYSDAFRTLSDTLLQYGGRAVVPPVDPDPFLERLRHHGELYRSGQRPPCHGEASNCHVNVARLWRTGDVLAIGTGYALSGDGLWREHTWGIDTDNRIVETTVSRTDYFGMRLVGEDAEAFAQFVDPVPSSQRTLRGLFLKLTQRA